MKTEAAVKAGRTDFSHPEGFCLGCKSDVISGWCAQCTFKECARKKGYDTCAECTEYPCTPIQGFIHDPDWLYHIETPGYIASIKKNGKAAWLKEMETRWSCPSCAQPADWYTMECTRCGTTLKGFKKVK
jgi:hypothetical protein